MASENVFEIIPTAPERLPAVEIPWPITPKENATLLLEKKTPVWVPNLMAEKGLVVCPHDNDRPMFFQTGKDWFGVHWTHVEQVGGQMVTPNTFIIDDMTKWEEKLIFPDLDSMDFTPGKDEAEERTNRNIINCYLMQNGAFERLLSLAPTEEVFSFLVDEEESALRYFNRMADYKIALMDKVIDEWIPFDVVINSDDWGTQISTFISPEMYAKYIFEPLKRVIDHAHSRGKFVFIHSCGKIESLMPQIIKYGAELWEGQRMNDMLALRKKYGREMAIQVGMDPDVTFRQGVSDQMIIDYVHHFIDEYALDGGLATTFMARDAHVNELIGLELFHYSMKHYEKYQ